MYFLAPLGKNVTRTPQKLYFPNEADHSFTCFIELNRVKGKILYLLTLEYIRVKQGKSLKKNRSKSKT